MGLERTHDVITFLLGSGFTGDAASDSCGYQISITAVSFPSKR
jgi:hypothetical protein